MRWVVFLRGVNVGRANRCHPAVIAKELARFGVINIGAVGTFAVREEVSEPALRAAIAGRLPFTCEIMICPAKEILNLAASEPFSAQPAGPEITRFVSILHRSLRRRPALPRSWPSESDWVTKVFAIKGRFVLGVYRREIKAIAYLAKVEKELGVPGTVRNWNTIEKLAKIIAA